MMVTARMRARRLLAVAFLLWLLAALLWVLAVFVTAGRLSAGRVQHALVLGVAFLADYALVWLAVWTRYALRLPAVRPFWWRLWGRVAWPAAVLGGAAVVLVLLLGGMPLP